MLFNKQPTLVKVKIGTHKKNNGRIKLLMLKTKQTNI